MSVVKEFYSPSVNLTNLSPFADVRLKKLNEEKHRMEAELSELQEQVADLRSQRRSGSMNGPFGEDWEETQRETQKQMTEYRFKLQKAEQEITTLQSNLARAETQVIRYKSTAEASEKSETELKRQKGKLQREVRTGYWDRFSEFIFITLAFTTDHVLGHNSFRRSLLKCGMSATCNRQSR